MQKRIKAFLSGMLFLVLLPFVITLLFQGEALFPQPSEQTVS